MAVKIKDELVNLRDGVENGSQCLGLPSLCRGDGDECKE